MPKNLPLSEFERCLTRYGLDLESWPNDAKLAALRLLDHNAQAQKIWRGEQVLRHYVPTLPALHSSLHDQTQNIALALAAQITNAHPRPVVHSVVARPFNKIMLSAHNAVQYIMRIWRDRVVASAMTLFWPQKRWSQSIVGVALASVTLLLTGSLFQEDQNNLSPFDLSMSYLLSDYETVYYEANDMLSLPEESEANSLAVSLISLD